MPIEAQGTLDFGDLLRATRRMYRNHRVSMAFMTGIGMLSLLLGVIDLIEERTSPGAPFLVAGILLSTRYWTNSYWFAWRQWNKNPNLRQPIQISMDENGCTFHTGNKHSEVRWSAFLKWEEERDLLLLYTNPVIAQIVPKRFFGAASQAARQLISRQIKLG